VVSSLSGADQLLSTVKQLDAPPIFHILLGVGIALLTCWLTLRGRKDASRVTFVIMFTYITLMVITFIALWVQSTQGVPPAPLPQPDPHATWSSVVGHVANAVLHGLVALTGLEAVSNGLQFIKDEDASYVRWGKARLPNWDGFWKFFSGRVGIARTIQVGFLFYGGITIFLNSHFSNYFNVIDGTNGRTLVGNLAAIALIPIGGNLLFYFRQIWSALTLSFANMTAYEDMQSTAYRDGVRGVLPVALVYRSPNGNFPRPVLMTFVIAVIIMIFVGGNTSSAIPLYGIGVFAPIAFMGFSVQRHLNLTKPKGYKVGSVACFLVACLSVIIFLSQLIGKFNEGGWVIIPAFSVLMILSHYFLLRPAGKRTDETAHHLIYDVSRMEGTMGELLMWQVRMIQTYRHNLKERYKRWRGAKEAVTPLEIYPPYEIHYDHH
jgi:amino acid transporter